MSYQKDLGYRLGVFIFKQDPSSAGDAEDLLASDGRFSDLTWDLTESLFPNTDLAITSFSIGGDTVENTETNAVNDLDLTAAWESTQVTHGDITLNFNRKFDYKSIVKQLEAVTGVEDNFVVLVKLGIYSSSGTGTRVYNVFWNGACLVSSAGNLDASPKSIVTSGITLKPMGLVTEGVSQCGQTVTLTTSTGAIAVADVT